MHDFGPEPDPLHIAPPSLRQRYVFVCGLHRSGTTLITRYLAEHPMVSGFKNTGAIEDEGQFLQTVLPVENAFGGVGRFGFDPRAHMTEDSALNTPAVEAKLKSEWRRYWDESKPILIEKTPSNLLRMRLFQELFQPSYFIIVTRHPVAASLAATKWTEGNLFSLLHHWVHCYRVARADAERIDRKLWISYEAFVAEPLGQLERISRFLGLAPYSGWHPQLRNQNADYFRLWRTQYFGDTDRSMEQQPPERPRNVLTRLRERLARDARESSLPLHRRRENRRNFYDALDAVALLESAIAGFGYSFTDLDKIPPA